MAYIVDSKRNNAFVFNQGQTGTFRTDMTSDRINRWALWSFNEELLTYQEYMLIDVTKPPERVRNTPVTP
jgi:hypothetical protein